MNKKHLKGKGNVFFMASLIILEFAFCNKVVNMSTTVGKKLFHIISSDM